MYQKNLLFFCLIFFFLSKIVFSQVVTINPSFATQSDNITVTFDASKGNAQLIGQPTVYAHTGVITDKSATPNSWLYVQGNWGTDDTKVKMTKVGNNLFQIQYNINNFYGIPTGEKVLKLAFVFRNVSGSLVGRESDGSDIFVPLSDGSFNARFSSPSIPGTVLNFMDSLQISASSSSKADIKLFIDDSLYFLLSNDSILSKVLYANAIGVGKHKLIFTATSGTKFTADTSYIIIRNGANIGVAPFGITDGINYLNDSTVVLQLFAAYKSFVYAIGDFNDWLIDPQFEMKNTPDGNRYWIQLNKLTPGKEIRFQYAVNKELLKIADPYSEKLLDPNNDQSIPSITYPSLIPYPSGKTTELVSVLQTAQKKYNWQFSTGFKKTDPSKLIIYELLVRDFIGRHDYQTLQDTLNYLQTLGINAIELMPFNEFEGNDSWGYNTTFYFAPDKYYGTKDALKSFIDECHRRGIAVIMDMVLNHSFGQSSMVRLYFDQSTGKPASNSPWFNVDATHPYNVGYDFNHESMYTQALVDTVLRYWVREYKIDGYRFDLAKGFTQTNNPTDVAAWSNYDQSRINIWKRISDKLRAVAPDCYMILEHFADNSEEKVLCDYGLMLWGNLNSAYNEASMGYSSDLSWGSYKARNFSAPNLVTYMESHDEERLMYKNITYGNSVSGYSVKDLNTALARMEAAASLFITLPGPKMIWQFGEMGYDVNIDYNGRIGDKPIRWEYLSNANRRRLHDVFAALIKLKTTYAVFNTSNYTFSAASTFKVLKLNDTSMNVLIAGNFAMTSTKQSPGFQHTGVWYDYFSGDSINISNTADSILIAMGSYKILTDKKLLKPNIYNTSGTSEINHLDQFYNIFPNPAEDILNIEFENNSNAKPQSISVFNTLGEKVLFVSDIHSNYISINTKELKPGVYFITISSDKINSTKKIIIN